MQQPHSELLDILICKRESRIPDLKSSSGCDGRCFSYNDHIVQMRKHFAKVQNKMYYPV